MSHRRRGVIGFVALAVVCAATAPAVGRPATERVIVVLEEGAGPPAQVAERLAERHGGEIGFVYRHAIQGFTLELAAAAVGGLSRAQGVAYVEEDVEVFLTQTGQTVPTGIDRVQADQNPPAAPVDVDIAVIDTGIWLGTNPDGTARNHEDLNVVAVTNCTEAIFYPLFGGCSQTGANDGNGHGTHVAGIAASKDNSVGSLGSAPGAKLWSLKAINDDGTGYLGGVLAAIDLATAYSAQIDVVNMSLTISPAQQSITDAVNASIDSGIVYVVAAGNSGDDVTDYSPANVPGVITVSALADFDGQPGALGSPTCRDDVSDDMLAGWSNFGSGVDLASPGVCIFSTWLNDSYAVLSGTSMASPLVAGAAARYIAENGKPAGRTGVMAVRDALVEGGIAQAHLECGFGGDPDAYPEPLLFMNGSAFGGSGACSDSASTNHPPLARDDTATTSEEVAVSVPVLSNDDDPDGDPLTITSVTDPAHGSTVIQGTNIVYTPDSGFSGTDGFNYSISDGKDGTATAGVTVTVESADEPLAASFVYDCVDLTCSFTDTSTDDGSITGHHWDFGDGNQSTAADPSHTYANPGGYDVTLTVTDDSGNQDTSSTNVTLDVVTQVMTVAVYPILLQGQNASVAMDALAENGSPVPEVTIEGEWSYLNPGGKTKTQTDGGVTDSSGTLQLSIQLPRNADAGSLTFCVTSASADGYRYEPSVECAVPLD